MSGWRGLIPRRVQRALDRELEQHLVVANVVLGQLRDHGAQRRVGDFPRAPGAEELVVVLGRRKRVQCVAPVALEVAPLRRRSGDEHVEPTVGEQRAARMQARPAVFTGGRDESEADAELVQEPLTFGGDRRRRRRELLPCERSCHRTPFAGETRSRPEILLRSGHRAPLGTSFDTSRGMRAS